jgi:hypothetical protein
MKIRPALVLAFVASCVAPAFAQNGKPDSEGFIRDWLVLGPHSIGENSGADAIDQQQFSDEAAPKAAEGAKQKVGAKELTWRKVATKDFFIDFKEIYPELSEHVAGWAVAYVVVPAAKTDLTLRMNSNDQGRVYLNGKEVVRNTEARTLEKTAEDSAKPITLKAGVNVVVLKVVNEENNWQGSLRFLDKNEKPVTDLKIETKP